MKHFIFQGFLILIMINLFNKTKSRSSRVRNNHRATGALAITTQTTTTKYRIDQNGSTVMNVRGVADTAVDVTYSTKPSLGTAYLGIGAGAFTITNTITTQYDTTQNMGGMGTVMVVGGVADSTIDVIY